MKVTSFSGRVLIWIFALFSATLSIAQVERDTAITSPAEALAFIDSVIEVFPSLRHDHAQKALDLTLSAQHLAKKFNSVPHLASTHYQLGVIYMDMGNSEKAFPLFESSLNYYQQIHDLNGVCLNYKWMGHIYDERGNKDKGLDLLLKALSIAQTLKLTDEILKIQNAIGVMLLNQGHYDEAINHFAEILAIERDPYARVAYMMNMAVAYKRKGNYDKAVEISKECLDICKLSKVESCHLWPRTFLLDSYISEGLTEQALEEAHFIVEEQRRLGLKKDELITLNTIGMIHRLALRFEDALGYFQKALALATEIDYPNLYMIYGNISIAYEGMGDYKKSLEYLVKETALKDSIFNTDKNKQIENLLARYETEKKEAEIERLKRDQELQHLQLEAQRSELDKERLAKNLAEKEKQYELTQMKTAYDLQQIKLENATIAREKKEQEFILLQNEKLLQEATVQNQRAKIAEQRLMHNFLVTAGAIVIIASLVIILVYQQKIRNQKLLALRTEEVNQQKILELIHAHEIQTIKATISGSEAEKKRISRELHDGIAGTLASIKLRLSKISTQIENPVLTSLIEQLNDAYNDVRSLSHHLTPPRIKNTAFTHLISTYVASVEQANTFSIELILFPEDELNELSDNLKVELYRIVQELLTNAAKHAQASQVEVQINKTPDVISVLVEDNGRGFDKNKIREGIGLSNIDSRVKILHGELDIDSRPARGSIININIPLYTSVTSKQTSAYEQPAN